MQDVWCGVVIEFSWQASRQWGVIAAGWNCILRKKQQVELHLTSSDYCEKLAWGIHMAVEEKLQAR